MSIESIDGALSALGLSLKNLFAGAVTSFVSLRFFDGQRLPDGSIKSMNAMQKWTTFVGGWAMAAYGGRPLNAWLELKPEIEIGVVLVLGLFGMAVAAELMRFIRETDWRAILSGLLRQKTGGGQ
jgi:hypothetical protein